MPRARSILFITLLSLCVPEAHAARPVTFDDVMQMRRVESPVMSPDGRWVVYVQRQWVPSPKDASKKENRTQLWRVGAEGGDARQLTFADANVSSPAFSPDGRHISFISARGDDAKPQLWIMRADGGEAAQLTDTKEGVIGYAWSPDSARVAFTSREAEPKDAEARRKRGDDRRLVEDEFRMVQLWSIDVATKSAVLLTDSRGFTVGGAPTWAPDSQRLAFAASPTPMLRDERQDIHILTLSDRRIEKVTTNPGPDFGPRWSPDGKTIAFITEPGTGKSMPDGTAVQDPRIGRLALLDVATGRVTVAADPKFEVTPSQMFWSPDSARLLFTAGKGTYNEAFSYEVASKAFGQLTRERTVFLGGVSKDGARVAFVLDSPTQPPDIYTADASFAAPRKLTDANPQAREFALGDSEVIRWTSDGIEIEGILLKPVGYTPGTKYPLLVVVHGGPAGAHLNTYRVASGDGGQHWAGQGWAVLYPNPRGGTNYGEAFMRANIPDWGGGDFRDIMRGVDAAIARGIADPDKLAIQGWSYGGYMTAWAITQTTRFKAAMVGAGITNLWSMYGTNDLPNYLSVFFRGIPSPETLPLYMERSAMTHIHKATTPTLILHGANDERVPIGQPMELHRGLKDRGVPTELVFYPRQGHGLAEYHHQLDRMQRQYDWITKHTLGAGARKQTTQ